MSLVTIKLVALRHAQPGVHNPALVKVAVSCGARHLFDAYLYDDADWWCVARGNARVFPMQAGGLTWNANTRNLTAFAEAHAARLGLLAAVPA